MTHLETTAERLDRHHQTGTITDREYEAIHLHEIKHMSYRTIAQGLSLSTATIWDRARRAEQKMRTADKQAA